MTSQRMIGALIAVTLWTFAKAETPDSIRQWNIGAGPAIVDAVDTPYVITAWRFGFLFQPQPRFDVQLLGDWAFSSTNTDMHYFRAVAGGDYFFTDEDSAPFVTADAGYASVHAHRKCESAVCESPDDDAYGFTLGLGAGMKFRRTACMSFGILAHYDRVFATTQHGSPDKYALTGMVYF